MANSSSSQAVVAGSVRKGAKRRKITATATPSNSTSSAHASAGGILDGIIGEIDGDDGSDDDDQSTPGSVDGNDEGNDDDDEEGGDNGWVECEILPLPTREIRGEMRKIDEPLPNFTGERFKGPNKKLIKDNDCQRPVDFLFLFFTSAVMEIFLSSTNSFGAHFMRSWEQLGMAEFKAFLAIILVLGLYKFPGRDWAWEKNIYGCKFAQNLMSLPRFNSILRAWHFEDYHNYSAEQLKQEKKKDPFFAVKKFVILLARSFENAFNPGQFMDIDEQSIPWKGRHIARCYNPSKPEKWHLKVFSLNDSSTGYMMSFYLYQGKSEQRPPNIPATEYPFHQLIGQKQKYANKNHIVVSDNWYTSESSIKFCIGSGNHSIGTVKTNKKGLCKSALFPKTGRARQTRGTAKQMVKTFNGNKKIYQVSWQDNKPVHLLASIPSYIGDVKRNSTNAQGQYEKVDVARPSVIGHYNTGMGGTDNQDQNMSYYRPKIKTRSWATRVLIHFLTAAMFNAFILYKAVMGDSAGMKYYKFKKFIRDVAEQLAEDWIIECKQAMQSEEDPDDSRRIGGYKSQKAWSADHIARCTGTHTPEISIIEKVEMKSGKASIRTNERGKCMICSTKTVLKCQECDVHLCANKKPNCLSCWEQFHSCKDLSGCTYSMPIDDVPERFQ